MTIVVVGGGAVGLLMTGWLAQSAQPVAMLARPRVTSALAAHPLHIDYQHHTQTIQLPVIAPDVSQLPHDYQRPALAILCVKSYDTAGTLPTLMELRPEQVLTLQNGIGNEEMLAEHLGSERVLSGVITSSIEISASDRITVTRAGGVGLAGVWHGTNVSPWQQRLHRAGFKVSAYADYRALKWSKLLLNMLGNATAAILDMPVASLYAHPRLIALERSAFLEVLAVMRRLQIQPVNLPGYPVALLSVLMRYLPARLLFPLLRRALAGGRGGKLPSLQRDLQQNRQHSEGAHLYGAIVAQAHAAGISAPVNNLLWSILNDIIAGKVSWDTFRSQPDRFLEVVDTTIPLTTARPTGKESHI